MWSKILRKILSARFCIAMLLTITFCWITIDGKVKADVFVPVLVMVLNFYFYKKRGETNEKIISNVDVGGNN